METGTNVVGHRATRILTLSESTRALIAMRAKEYKESWMTPFLDIIIARCEKYPEGCDLILDSREFTIRRLPQLTGQADDAYHLAPKVGFVPCANFQLSVIKKHRTDGTNY